MQRPIAWSTVRRAASRVSEPSPRTNVATLRMRLQEIDTCAIVPVRRASASVRQADAGAYGSTTVERLVRGYLTNGN